MSDAYSTHLVVACIHLLPALVWGIAAQNAWRFVLTRRPQRGFFWILPAVTSLNALHYALHVLIEVTPTELEGHAAGLHVVLEALIGVSLAVSIALLRHMVLLMPVREERPGRAWLVVNYGSAAVVSAIEVFAFGAWPADTPSWVAVNVLSVVYALVMGGLSLGQLWRLARRGAWRPGAFELSSPDVVILVAVLLLSAGLLFAWLGKGGSMPITSIPLLALHSAVGLALAVPFVVRMLGETIEMLLMATGMGAATAAALGLHVWASGLPSLEARRLVDLAAVVGLVLALGPGQAWLRVGVDHLVFRRSRHRRAELAAFLHTLSPELGPLECCRRALAELARVMQMPGAAIMLAHQGGAVALGTVRLEPLRAAWPDDPAAVPLPRGALPVDAREVPLPLRAALVEADIAGVAAITSPRRHWGHLFAAEGFIRGRVENDDIETVGTFVSQLALVLDGAELLARTVAVERSLAHSEKLAAIGELAARIAHEIRNPVTAARSLAQQLCREPTSSFTAEHALILAELERVERQVAALLRFARREEFRFERVDLGELARSTVDTFRPRLEAAGVAVTVEAAAGAVARADREKVRQVLVNLIENALDALGETPGERRLVVAVESANGCVTLRVADTGPGVPADALPHLFEPFFSLKAHGTGLGLAIARRTVEAHGGRMAVTSPPGEGTAIAVDLPAAAAP